MEHTRKESMEMPETESAPRFALNLCHNKACKKAYHRHITQACFDHPFCTPPPFKPTTNPRFLPSPNKQELKRKEQNRIVVTEYALDHWLAQNLQYSLNNIPSKRPPDIPPQLYERLRKYSDQTRQTGKDFLKMNMLKIKKKKNEEEEQLGLDSKRGPKQALDYRSLKPYLVHSGHPFDEELPIFKRKRGIVEGRTTSGLYPQNSPKTLLTNSEGRKRMFQSGRPRDKSKESGRAGSIGYNIRQSFLSQKTISSKYNMSTPNSNSKDFISGETSVIFQRGDKRESRDQASMLGGNSGSNIPSYMRKTGSTTQTSGSKKVVIITTPVKSGKHKFDEDIVTRIENSRSLRKQKEDHEFEVEHQLNTSVPQVTQGEEPLGSGMDGRPKSTINNMFLTPQKPTLSVRIRTTTGSKRHHRSLSTSKRIQLIKEEGRKDRATIFKEQTQFSNYLRDEIGDNLVTEVMPPLGPGYGAYHSLSKTPEVVKAIHAKVGQKLLSAKDTSSSTFHGHSHSKIVEDISQEIYETETGDMGEKGGSAEGHHSPTKAAKSPPKISKKALDYVICESDMGDQSKGNGDSLCELSKNIEFVNPLEHKGNVLKDAEFWFHRGSMHAGQNNLEQAIHCYKQGLTIDNGHIPLLFNLACCFEKIHNFSKGEKCFSFVLKIKPEWIEARYGLALCHFKLLNYPSALENIDQAISLGDQEEMEKKSHFFYLRALCFKQLSRFEEASNEYKKVCELTRCSQFSHFKNFVLGMFALPLQTDRKLILEHMNQFKPLSSLLQENFHKSILFKYYEPEEGWETDKTQHIVYTMQNLKFFKRFNKAQIEQMLAHIRIERIKINELIFVNEKEVGVLVEGDVAVRSHEKSLSMPRIIAKYGPGDIIGYKSDGGVSRKTELWFRALSTVEIAVIDIIYFDYLWHQQKTCSSKVLISLLTSYVPFMHLTDQSIYMLAQELMTTREFPPGQIVCRMSKRSILHQKYEDLFTQRVSKVLREATRSKTQQHTIGDKEFSPIIRKLREKVGIGSPKRGSRSPQSPNKGGKSPIIKVQEASDEEYESDDGQSASAFSHGRKGKQGDPRSPSKQKYSHLLDKLVTGSREDNSVAGSIMHSGADDISECRSDILLKELHEKGLTGKNERSQAEEILTHILKPSYEISTQYQDLFNAITREESDGIYVIESGECILENPLDGYVAATLTRGDIFGESEIIHIIGYNYFGNIRVGESGVICYYLSKKMLERIPDYELRVLNEACKKRDEIEKLAYTSSKRYSLPLVDFNY